MTYWENHQCGWFLALLLISVWYELAWRWDFKSFWLVHLMNVFCLFIYLCIFLFLIDYFVKCSWRLGYIWETAGLYVCEGHQVWISSSPCGYVRSFSKSDRCVHFGIGDICMYQMVLVVKTEVTLYMKLRDSLTKYYFNKTFRVGGGFYIFRASREWRLIYDGMVGVDSLV